LPEHVRLEFIERPGESKVILRAPADTAFSDLVPELETAGFQLCGGQAAVDQIPYVTRCIQEICDEKRCRSHTEVEANGWGMPRRCDILYQVWLPQGGMALVGRQLASICTRQFPASQAGLIEQTRSDLMEPHVQIKTYAFDDQVLLIFISPYRQLSVAVANLFKHVAL
jgi:hypothetical protein